MLKKMFAVATLLILSVGFLMPANIAPVLAAPSLTRAETIVTDAPSDDDAYFVGENVTIGKDVRGDVVVMGGTVTINGNVSGDIWVVGGTVAINGRVGDDVRLMGGTLTITKEVVDDVLAAGGTLVVSDTATIRGDLWSAAGDLSIYGRIVGNLMTWAGTARINGTIDGAATVRYSEALTFGNGARIKGPFDYYAPMEDPSFANYASKVTFHEIADTRGLGTQFAQLLTIAGLTVVVWKWLSFLILGAMLIWIYPKYFPRMIDGIQAREQASSFVWAGLLYLVAIPALAMVFAMTVIGLPLSFILFLLFALMLVSGAMAGAYAVGSYLRRHKHNTEWDQLGNLALGILVTIIVGYIPLLGWLFTLAVMLFGIGAIMHELKRLTTVYRNHPPTNN